MTVNLQLIIELCYFAVINYHQEVFLATSYSFGVFVVIDVQYWWPEGAVEAFI